jgi:hypothetical protein
MKRPMVVTSSRRRARTAARVRQGSESTLRDATAREATLGLIAIAVFSTVLRVLAVRSVHAPIIFSDELGYEKLAQSIGLTGHLGLFNNRGLSYAPLYPAVLSPIYALDASASTAYALIKSLNAVLISFSVFPIFKIARFVLPRRASLLVAALAAAAPLMAYSSYAMSENLAYPVCMATFWAMVEAVRNPRPRNDVVLLAALLVASLARTQLVALVPAALTAVVLVAVLERAPKKLSRRVIEAANNHRVLVGATGAALLAAAAGAAAGKDVLSIFGRYALVGRVGVPPLGHVIYVFAQHLAGVDLAVGVVPFVGAIVAAVVFLQKGRRRTVMPFAVVALSVTVWLLVEVALDAARFDGGADLPRIHERFLIYVVPLFLIALFATLRAVASARVYLAAGVVAALLPAVIPFNVVVNGTTIVDTFSLQPFAYSSDGGDLGVVPHARIVAACVAAVLALLFVALRQSERGVVLLVLVPSVVISILLLPRISSSTDAARAFLPVRTDWVDAVKPHGTVALLTGARRAPALETAFSNLSISRLYYLCRPATSPEFGEQPATIGESGTLREPSGPIVATYVVAPAKLGIEGRVVARNRRGGQVLVAPADGRLRVPADGVAAARRCPAARPPA